MMRSSPTRVRTSRTASSMIETRVQLGLSVLADSRPPDLAAEHLRDPLLPVAEAEHRNAQIEEGWVHGRGAGRVHARRPAGQDQPLGATPADLIDRGVVWKDLGEDLALA